MSRFYGVLSGQAGAATRCGSKKSGLRVTAASWVGCVTVELYVDGGGRDCFSVRQEVWHGAGCWQEIASGRIGESAKQKECET